MIMEVQNLLRRAGFNPGPVDGILGPQTWQAWSRFLGTNGLDGNLTTVPRFAATISASTAPDVWRTVVTGSEVQTGQGTWLIAPTPPGITPTSGVPMGQPANLTTGGSTGSDLTPEEEKQIRSRYGDASYLLYVPEVRALIARSIRTVPPWSATELSAEISKTEWYRTTAAATRLWDDEMARDPAQAMWRWNQRTVVISNTARQMGLDLSDTDAQWLAGRVLREGWSDEQLNRWFGQMVRERGRVSGGSIAQTQSDLKGMARSYMSMMSDKDALEFATRITEGTLSVDGVRSMLRDQAKNRFSWMSDQIDAGLTPSDLFRSTRNVVADVLEMDPEQIDLNDQRWSALTSPVLDNGSTRSMNYHEAQQWARARPEWRLTNNANREASDLTLNLMKVMGVMG
jgi:peptidoglycan hydrolase-like protein with peptidoglycan-binding domain